MERILERIVKPPRPSSSAGAKTTTSMRPTARSRRPTQQRRPSPAEKHAPDDELDGHVHLPTRRKARIRGFDLDAGLAVRAQDRDRLERLARYLLRAPIALDRLRYLPPAARRSASRAR